MSQDRCGEFIMLGREHYGVDAERFAGLCVVFDRVLGLRVRTEIGHHPGLVVADRGEKPEGLVRKGERKGHMLLCLGACVSEHHSLVACALFHRITPVNSLADVPALLVEGGEHTAGFCFETISRIVVAYGLDRLPD